MKSQGPPTWQQADDIAVVDNDERVVILALGRPGEPPVVLSGSGARIWRCLDASCSQEQLVDRVAETYAVERDRIRAEVESFLAELQGLGVAVRVDLQHADAHDGQK
ncbi:MAG: PqqD family protein [Nocardioidaceae bacterium]